MLLFIRYCQTLDYYDSESIGVIQLGDIHGIQVDAYKRVLWIDVISCILHSFTADRIMLMTFSSISFSLVQIKFWHFSAHFHVFS